MYAGPVEDLVDIIAPYAYVPDFISYSEKLDAPVAPGKILKLRHMWKSLHSIQPNLAFSQKTMESVFDRVATVNAGDDGPWLRPLAPIENIEWKQTVSRRFRAQARAISQSETKNPKRGWILRLWSDAIVEPVEETQPIEDAEDAPAAAPEAAPALAQPAPPRAAAGRMAI